MFLTRLAFKNLVRHRNRTLITSVIIAFAIFFYIIMDSLLGGMIEMSYESIIDYEAGHLQVVDEEYWEEEEELPLENLLLADERLMNVTQSVPGYLAGSPELNFQARLNNGTDELPVIGRGIIPKAFEEVFALDNQFVKGSMFTLGEYKAVMGKKLAELMELTVGDYITLLVKDKNETFNTIEAEISGLVHTANPNINQNIVYLPLDLAQGALNVDGLVSKVIVRLEDKNMAVEAAAELKNKLGELSDGPSVYAWNELEAFTFAEVEKVENRIIMAIILSIAAIAIINTVILAALERQGEIGMMKAMGLRNIEVVYTFVLESIGIGILGGIIGMIMGMAGVWIMATYGIDFDAMMDMDMASFGVPVVGTTYGVWNPWAFLTVFSFGVLVSLVASIYPAYRAANKDPVKTLYHR